MPKENNKSAMQMQEQELRRYLFFAFAQPQSVPRSDIKSDW
jgi:hypothetical protein